MEMDLDKWNPMEEDYSNRRMNAYREGVGQDLQSRDIGDVGSVGGAHNSVVLYISNVPLDMDEIALQNVFEQEGKVIRVAIPTPSPDKVVQFQSKIGFVTMENARGAQAAIENLNAFQVKGRSLSVKVKQSREEMARRRDQREREEEFYRSVGFGRDNKMAAGASSGVPELPVAYRNAGPSGDAPVSNLSVTVNQDIRKVQERGGKGLLPVPGSRVPVISPPLAHVNRGQVHSPNTVCPSYAPSMAGSDVGSDLCASCERMATMRCKACRKVYYCNATCQKSHWHLHRRTCTYDTRVPTVPAVPSPQPMLQPDFENMEVDVDEDYVKNNEEYLTNWLRKSGVLASSDSSSSSGERGTKARARQGGRQPGGPVRNSQPHGPQQGLPTFDPHRRGGPQGVEGRPQGRNNRGPGQPGREGSKGQGGAPREWADQRRREAPGNSPPQGPAHLRTGTQGGSQPVKNGPQQDGRGGHSRNGPENLSGGQVRNGPQGDRYNQFKPRNCPQEDRGDTQPRSSPQKGKGGPSFQGERGDQSYKQRGDRGDQRADGGRHNHRGPQQGGPLREMGGPGGPRRPEGARGFPQNKQTNERRPGQFTDHRDGNHAGGARFDRDQGKQQDRGNSNNNRWEKKPFGAHRSDAGSRSGGDDNACEEATPESPPSRGVTSAGKAATNSPVAVAAASRETSAESRVTAVVPLQASHMQPAVPKELYGNPLDLVELNKPVTVVVSYVQSPQCFWVQLADQLSAFVPFIARVLEEYTERGPVTEVKVGQLFVCKCDGELARARVESVHEAVAKVFYVDYGNSEEVQLSELQPVPSELTSLPPLGLACQLAVRSSVQDGEWKDDVCEVWREEFNMKSCTLTVLHKQSPLCQVTLIRCHDGKDAATFLKEKGFAVDASETVAPPVPCTRRMARDMGQVMDQLSVGQRVEVVVLEFADPLHIFVHLTDREIAFIEFTAHMLTAYNQMPPVPYQPVVGEVVVGRFSADNCWYRAEVLEVFPEGGEASLFYMDFGNREQRPFEELRALLEEDFSVPVHGLACAMESFRHSAGGQWREEQLADFLTCLRRYMRQVEEVPLCTVVVDGLREGKVWVDMVSDHLTTTLSQELTRVMDERAASRAKAPAPPPSSLALPPAALAPPPAALAPPPAAPPMVTEVEELALKRPTVERLEKVTLPLGERLAVGIQEILSCQCFFVNKKTAEGDLEVLRVQLVEVCQGKQPPAVCRSVSVGDVVLVKFSEDEQWYRGQVETVSDDRQTCGVFFLDYGNREDKEVSSLREMPLQLSQLPGQAVVCALVGIPSPAPQELERKFHSMCLLREAVVHVVGREGDCHLVEVFSSDNEPLTTMLGLEPPAPTDTAEVSQDASTQGATASPSQHLPALEGGDENDAQKGSASCPVQEMAADGNGAASAPPPLEEASKNGEATLQAATPSPSPQCVGVESVAVLTKDCLPVVAAEDAEGMDMMIVTHVVTPAHFYAIHQEHYLMQNDEGGLVPQLQEVNVECPPLDHLPAVGELLSGLFEGVWYRCEVLELRESQVRVFFFDYGNEAMLEVSDLRPLPGQLCHNYPLATIRCSLGGVSPVGGEGWDEESGTVCRELMENQRVGLMVCGATERGVRRVTATLTAIDHTGNQTQDDVGQTLVKLGKAVVPSTKPQAQTNDAEKDELMRQMAALQARLAAMK